MRILTVEDEPSILRLIRNALERSGHLVDTAEDGAEAIRKIEIYDYDIIILDIMLPELDGTEVCRYIRKLKLNSKIIMLTAKDDVDTKIKCLNMGADDYMTKPFSFDELDARIRALSRREKIFSGLKLKADSLELDPITRTIKLGGKKLKVTHIEFRLMEFLIRHKNQICTRTMLEENVWGNKENVSNVMNATVSKLRNKIKKISKDKNIIKTMSKSGYMIST
jgi:DNA-binding response OmpR family regulator